MEPPQIPANESERLADLRALKILDTPFEQPFERITRIAKIIFGVPIVAISLVDANRQWFKSVQGLDVYETPRESSFCGHTILEEELFVIKDTYKDIRFKDNPMVVGEPKIRFYAGSQIKSVNGNNLGTLCIIDSKPRELSEEHLALLIDLKYVVQREIQFYYERYRKKQLMKELEETQQKSLLDPLTRVYNRGAIENILIQKTTFAKNSYDNFVLAMIDIDDFKLINDSHGHSVGDTVLKTVSKTLLEASRDEDVLGRWGGDEFLLIIDTPESKVAETILMRVLDKIRNLQFVLEDSQISITATIGAKLVEYDAPETYHDHINEADKNMYEGKASGKNKVVLKPV